MARESLFNAVKQLQNERKARHADMMSFMRGLDGTGQIGYAIGYGLSRLFGGGAEREAAEERTAQNKNEYVRAYMAATPEQRPYLFDRGMQEFPDYAIQVQEYQDEQDTAAATAAANAERLDLERRRVILAEKQAGQVDTSPLTKVQQDYYTKLLPDVAEEVGTTDTTWDPRTWFSGLSSDDKRIIIENAEMLRRSNKATNMTPRQALKLATSNYIGGGATKTEADAEKTVQAQNKLDLLNKAAD